MNEILRQEKKFVITLDYYYKYRDYLSKVIKGDSHNGDEGYTVRSLYFDSIDDRDYYEKLDGVELRRKIRLRIYHPSDKMASLEMKQKQGPYQKKRTLRIKREEAMLLTEGNYDFLLNYEEPFASECYSVMNMFCYRPKSIIEYRREAFVQKENNTRITFDRNIQATESCYDIFSNNLNMNPIWDNFTVILEVKYINFLLSYVKDIINECEKSEQSVSKYILGRGSIV